MAFSWAALSRPVRALAPMEDVTDTVFRRIIAGCGRPDVFFTEFIHTDIVLAPRGDRPGITPRLRYTESERPLIAQIWGTDPEAHLRAAQRIRELGFDGVDINMGCPVRKITKKGACSALINDPSLVSEIVHATREAGLPTSVKTRIGFNDVQTESWISHLLSLPIQALTVHGRTAVQESEGEADWSEVTCAVQLRNGINPSVVILGNGDIADEADVKRRVDETGVDGVMVGRGVFNDPYLFGGGDPYRAAAFRTFDAAERIQLLTEHLRLYREEWGDERNYEILKKFYKIYLVGFRGSAGLRDGLNTTHDYDAAEHTIREWKAGRV